jgi:hypothetical protein
MDRRLRNPPRIEVVTNEPDSFIDQDGMRLRQQPGLLGRIERGLRARRAFIAATFCCRNSLIWIGTICPDPEVEIMIFARAFLSGPKPAWRSGTLARSGSWP